MYWAAHSASKVSGTPVPGSGQKLADLDDPANRDAFLKALTRGSAVSWQHVNLLGEYDFSEERLQDTVGIKPPKLAD
jgi:hypothetical protein